MPPWLLAGGGALALIGGAIGGWTVRGWKANSDQLAATAAADAKRELAEARIGDKAAELETLRAESDLASARTQTQLREVYREVKVPAECAVPADAVSLLDRALERAAAEAAGQPRGAVPAPAGSPGGADRP